MNFPEKINITIIKEDDNTPVKGVYVAIKLFSKYKKDFYIITQSSDEKGIILVTKNHIRNEVESKSPPDSKAGLDDYNSMLLIWVIGKKDTTKILEGINSQKILSYPSDRFIDQLKNYNLKIESKSELFEFRNNNDLDVTFKCQLISLTR